MSDCSNELVLEFMELYQAEPTIYDPKHPAHKNNMKVNDAWLPLTRMRSERCDRDVWTGTYAHECSVNHSWSNLGDCVRRYVEVALCTESHGRKISVNLITFGAHVHTAEVHRRFGRRYCLHVRGRRVSRTNSLPPVCFWLLIWSTLWLCRWGQYVPPKRQWTSIWSHVIISQKINIFLVFSCLSRPSQMSRASNHPHVTTLKH
jgi:hypothetical protein